MKLNHITFMVRDLEKSVKFYRELLGLNVINQMDLPLGKIIFLSDTKDATMLELIEFKDTEKVDTKGLVMSYLANRPIEDLHDKARKLGYNPTDIIEQGAKPKHFIIIDPDGITIELSA